MRWILCGAIRFYQLALRPFIGPVCRFTPTCSEYGYAAIQRYGCLYGSYLTIKRLLRCHPYCDGGHDPVP